MSGSSLCNHKNKLENALGLIATDVVKFLNLQGRLDLTQLSIPSSHWSSSNGIFTSKHVISGNHKQYSFAY